MPFPVNNTQGGDLIRTALFVPGDKPERFLKALASGADRVIVDFEDAVAEADKAHARACLEKFLSDHPEARVLVRINSPAHAQHEGDLSFCRDQAGVIGVVLPKAERSVQVGYVAGTGKPVLPIIESALGAVNLAEICAVPGVERLSFGAIDMALDLDLKDGSPGALIALNQLRVAVVLHSKANGLSPALDGVFPAIEDNCGLIQAVRTSQQMGFGGVLCIHPKQVASIHSALAPSEDEATWAKRVLDAASSEGGAFKLDGQMIDTPVLIRAQRIINSLEG